MNVKATRCVDWAKTEKTTKKTPINAIKEYLNTNLILALPESQYIIEVIHIFSQNRARGFAIIK